MNRMKLLQQILCLVVLLLSACGKSQPNPAKTLIPLTPAQVGGGKGRIVFVSGGDIYVINTDGSNWVKLTTGSAKDADPDWSPDGQRIAFTSNEGIEGTGHVFIMNADGSGVIKLTNDPWYSAGPSWSPDGKKIAYYSIRDRNFNIFSINIDGTGETQLTNGGSETFPVWSPDGKKILYSSKNPIGLYIMNADGTGQQLVSNGFYFSPVWSPDSKKIAFAVNSQGCKISEINPDGTDLLQLMQSDSMCNSLAWSPDGKKIIYAVSDNKGGLAFYMMNADGSDQRKLPGFGGENPDWQP